MADAPLLGLATRGQPNAHEHNAKGSGEQGGNTKANLFLFPMASARTQGLVRCALEGEATQ